MKISTFLPTHPLNLFVEGFWYLEDWDPIHPKERILPKGNLELIIDVSDSKFASQTGIVGGEKNQANLALIKGIHSKFSDIDTRAHVSLIGIEFKPGGSYPFFTLPVDEFHNLLVPLIDLWNDDLSLLSDQLLNAVTVEECFQSLEKFLFSKIIQQRRLNPAVAFALNKIQQPFNPDKISQIVEKTGYSGKHFIKLFREQVGLSPKLFSRLQRFQHCVNRMKKNSQPCWAELAIEGNFFDQSHFINEFRYFAGLTPAEYLQKSKSTSNHLPLAGKR